MDGWVGALENPASYGKSINLGSGKRLSINDVADAVLCAFGRTRADLASSGTSRLTIPALGNCWDWEPRVSFETGLAETIQWSVVSMAAAGAQSQMG